MRGIMQGLGTINVSPTALHRMVLLSGEFSLVLCIGMPSSAVYVAGGDFGASSFFLGASKLGSVIRFYFSCAAKTVVDFLSFLTGASFGDFLALSMAAACYWKAALDLFCNSASTHSFKSSDAI